MVHLGIGGQYFMESSKAYSSLGDSNDVSIEAKRIVSSNLQRMHLCVITLRLLMLSGLTFYYVMLGQKDFIEIQ